MQRCPNCRARYCGGDQCRRCGMTLTPLLTLEIQADRLARRAVRLLAAGDASAARQCIERARQQVDSPFLRALQAFIPWKA